MEKTNFVASSSSIVLADQTMGASRSMAVNVQKIKGFWLSGAFYGEDGSMYREKEYVENYLPVGFRFMPTDEELIVHYLINKINNKQLPFNAIRDVHLYDFPTPEKLTANYELIRESEWYFFTPRKKKYLNGRRPDRLTPGGYWKSTTGDVEIESNGRIVGVKKTLCFYEGKPTDAKKTNWIMHEYRVIESSRANSTMKLNDWVLCKIYRYQRGVKRKYDHAGEDLPRKEKVDQRIDGLLSDDSFFEDFDHWLTM